MRPNPFTTVVSDNEKHPPPIRIYLISFNMGLLLLFAAISMLFWHQVANFHESGQAEDIAAIQASMRERSASLLRSMALSSTQALAGYDFTFLNTLMQQVASGDEEIRYCLVTDKTGVLVAHSDPALVGTTPQSSIDILALSLMADKSSDFASKPGTIRFLQNETDPPQQNGLLEAVTTIRSGHTPWGILRCGFSTHKIREHISHRKLEWDKQIRQTRVFFLSVVVAFVLVGFLVAVFLTRRMLNAVDHLALGVQRVSDGHLDRQLSREHTFCAEFDALALAFNEMTQNLLASRRQLDEYSRSLEQKVVERTRELEHSNKELEAFNYSVSHDLRAPLRSIDGFSQALLEDYSSQVDETARDYLMRVRAAANRMGTLIDDMLRLSRLSRQEMNIEMVDLSDLATQAFVKLRETDPERPVNFRVEPELTIEGDSHLLAIAMDNLIGNAWKYTCLQDPAEIKVGSIKEKKRKVFFVRDNGIGFNMKYADKLFVAFQRLHNSSEFEGTGIGLATVARIIHRHGGIVWAESEEGKGATFYFELPG